ncbi:nuclear transport factor 2 family protein [Burkholderia sp. WAC0059]|uniref:nuclear transport factor 2 family protein n=1 Tax=Burkholderia sp. WAC0059 TaxID=2066022 RepID=UPI001CA5A55E|nr:nuclear transport factor 2 family protein [Burkholderia sp. WAC0059]
MLGKLGQGDAEAAAALFAEDAEWDIAGDANALPWIGRKRGRHAVNDFIRDSDRLVERLKLDVEDILANERRAVVVGELASKVKSTGKVIETSFVLVLDISGGRIARFRMLEDSFAVSQAARGA